MNFVNFNEHITAEKYNVYGGSEKKRTVVLDDGNQYLLKFPEPIRETNRDISYINNSISEYIGCHIFKQLGFETQDTILGTFDINEKVKVACACKDLRSAGENLYEADRMALSLLDNEELLTFDSVRKFLHNIKGVDAKNTYHEYCRRFIVDALIGNTDRHNGNWGFIENPNLGSMKIAPVYDCGSSLSSLLAEKDLTQKRLNNDAQNAKSAIRDNNGVRIHYRDFLLSGENKDVNRALTEVVPKINLNEIFEMINEIPYISEARKNFYCELLGIRYREILIPALENVLGIKKDAE